MESIEIDLFMNAVTYIEIIRCACIHDIFASPPDRKAATQRTNCYTLHSVYTPLTVRPMLADFEVTQVNSPLETCNCSSENSKALVRISPIIEKKIKSTSGDN